METYTTISGDTWDMIAHKKYGEALYADKIMEANMQYLDYMIFPAGVVLNIPDRDTFTETAVLSDYPNWKGALNGNS